MGREGRGAAGPGLIVNCSREVYSVSFHKGAMRAFSQLTVGGEVINAELCVLSRSLPCLPLSPTSLPRGSPGTQHPSYARCRSITHTF